MTDKLLNLVSAMEDEFLEPPKILPLPHIDDYDYVLNWELEFSSEKDYDSYSVTVDVVDEFRKEFESLEVSSGARKEGDGGAFWLEAKVKE